MSDITKILEEFRCITCNARASSIEKLKHSTRCPQPYLMEQGEELTRLRAENEKLRALLVRWMAAYPNTHNIAGQPVSLVQNTLVALGREPLEPL